MIQFFEEDISFSLSQPSSTINWIQKIIEQEGFQLGELNYIFCSDEYLHSINKQYLNHNTLTDIITFDQSEDDDRVEADIFISVDRVRENASDLVVSFEDELDRVLIHGVLHLIGYSDHTPEEKIEMRKKEEACLSLRE